MKLLQSKSTAYVAAIYGVMGFAIHGIVAAGILLLDQRPGGASVQGWDLVRILEFADSPVRPAIYWVGSHFWLVLVKWVGTSFGRAAVASEIAAFLLVGGVFYATLMAVVGGVLHSLSRQA